MNMEEQWEDQQEENTALKAKVQVLKTEHVKSIASLEEKYQNEIAEYQKENAELKVKLATQHEVFEEKLKQLEEMIHTNKQKISEAEDEIMVVIHQMKLLLPAENWHDLLAFVPRCQLGNVVSQIGDYHFTKIIQSFLHDEVRKITLGKMEIIAPRPYLIIAPRPCSSSSDQPIVKVGHNTATNMPDWPMPGNIKDFEEIVLNYVDTSVLHFLGKFQENSLLADVNMRFADYTLRGLEEEDMDMNMVLLTFLNKIAPCITSIDSMDSRGIDLWKLVYNNNTNHGNSGMLLKEMMEKTRIQVTDWYIHNYQYQLPWGHKMDLFCSWLYTPRKDGKPRMLRLFNYFFLGLPDQSDAFVERIKKDFEMANHAVSFFIYAELWGNDNIEDISIDNVKTNEKLVIKMTNRGSASGYQQLMILRFPLKAAKNWIEANMNEIIQWNRKTLIRKITLTDGLTIGI